MGGGAASNVIAVCARRFLSAQHRVATADTWK
jgi:hypothetical protein